MSWHVQGIHAYIWSDLPSYIRWPPNVIYPFSWPITCHVSHVSFQPILLTSFCLRQDNILSRASHLFWTGADINSDLECLCYCTVPCSFKIEFHLRLTGVPLDVYGKGNWVILLHVCVLCFEGYVVHEQFYLFTMPNCLWAQPATFLLSFFTTCSWVIAGSGCVCVRILWSLLREQSE